MWMCKLFRKQARKVVRSQNRLWLSFFLRLFKAFSRWATTEVDSSHSVTKSIRKIDQNGTRGRSLFTPHEENRTMSMSRGSRSEMRDCGRLMRFWETLNHLFDINIINIWAFTAWFLLHIQAYIRAHGHHNNTRNRTVDWDLWNLSNMFNTRPTAEYSSAWRASALHCKRRRRTACEQLVRYVTYPRKDVLPCLGSK